MKIIAFYLPQFHAFPENDKWWGKGFTEWSSVKSAKPIIRGHIQPRIPLNGNYYNLLNEDVMKWQANLAKQYGVYGFCYYHYWFGGKLLMEKPMENMLHNRDIDLPFCICWANENWTRAWSKKSNEVLIAQTYGGQNEWKEHFEYLCQFWRDDRYIKIDGKPLMVIYRPEIIPVLSEMLEYWQILAKENGFKGIVFAYQRSEYDHRKDKGGDLFQYGIEYQPSLVKRHQDNQVGMLAKRTLNIIFQKFPYPLFRWNAYCSSYDRAWKEILKIIPRDEKMLPGAFVNWDATPRHKRRGSFYLGATPEKFRRYLSEQIKRAKHIYKKDMIFIFAWNEWGEGGYLEPDEQYKYGMLEAVREALIENDEWTNC